MRTVFDQIVAMIAPGSSVLDLGCDDCSLLERLVGERGVIGRGVDISERSIQACIKKGIGVFQGDLDEGLKDYASGSYDFVILSRTLQQVHDPVALLSEMLRVGKAAIVNFPNFGYVANRLQLALGGTMPENRHLPYSWYNTPNIHFCTLRDFHRLCRRHDFWIERELYLRNGRTIHTVLPNLFATEVCCTLRTRAPRRNRV